MKKVGIVYLSALAVLFIFGKELVLYTFAMGFIGVVIRLVVYAVFLLPVIVWLVMEIVKSQKRKAGGLFAEIFGCLILMFLLFGAGPMIRFEPINTARDLFAKPETVESVAHLTYSRNNKTLSRGHYMLEFREDEEQIPYSIKMYMRVSKFEKWYDNHGRQIVPKSLIGYDKTMMTRQMKLKVKVTYYPNSRTRIATEILEVLES